MRRSLAIKRRFMLVAVVLLVTLTALPSALAFETESEQSSEPVTPQQVEVLLEQAQQANARAETLQSSIWSSSGPFRQPRTVPG